MGTISGHFLEKPGTGLGRWAVWLEAVFVALFILDIALNVLGFENNPALEQAVRPVFVIFIIFMLFCGLAGGVLGAIALIRYQERALAVWAATFVSLFVLLIFLNELWQGIAYFLGV